MHALLLVALTPFPQDRFDFAAAWRDVTARFHAACDEHKVVGASLLFARGRETLGLEHHGFADRTAARRVDADTIFHWASITKTFTAIAILQLRDRGRLRLDQPMIELVPELRAVHPAQGRVEAITIAHLLSHAGGFRASTWPWGGDQPWHPFEPTRWEQVVAMLPYTQIEFAPGSRFSYSNPGYVFLGRAIATLSGDDYEVYLDKNVLRPLGMLRSYFDVTPYHLQKHRSHRYRRAAGKEGAIDDQGAEFDTGITVANGGLNAPLPDMARYLAFLLGDVDQAGDAAGVLSRASLQAMWEQRLPTGLEEGLSMGLSFFVMERGGQRFLAHTGGQGGYVAFFYVHPASQTGALGAFNTSTAGPIMEEISKRLMDGISARMVALR